jgi:hypothetical protein
MSRPHSEARLLLLDALKAGPGSTRVMAGRAGLDVACARECLNNMVRKGIPQAVVLRKERMPGVNRPVPIYAPLDQPGTSDAANDSGVMRSLAAIGQALFAQGVGA